MTSSDTRRTFFAAIDLDAGELGGYSISPFLPGDSLDACRFILRTAAPHADVLSGIDVVIGLYVLTGRLGTDTPAEIANGFELMPPLPLPLTPAAVNAGAALGTLSFEIPTIFVSGQLNRYLGITVQAPTNVGIVGSVLAKVFRSAKPLFSETQ